MSNNLEASEEEGSQAFSYPEEPLGISAEIGLGYFQGGPGCKIGPRGRYEIKQKLGYGTASSVWLAHDEREKRFVTVKILSGYCSKMNLEHNLQELDIYRNLNVARTEPHCAHLLDHFSEPGVDKDDGPHLCLVLELLQCHIYEVIKTLPADATLPLPIIKRVIKHLLRGISFLHRHGVAHTDIKPDNMMISMDPKFDIAKWVSQNPPKTYDPVPSLKGPVTSYVSHQFPPPELDELPLLDFVLSDLSNAQFIHHQTTDDISPLGLRAPEVLLGGEWDQSVDIWTMGSMVFYFLTLQNLFKAEASRLQVELFWRKDLRPPEIQSAYEASQPIPDSVDFLLYQIAAFCEGPFPPQLLRACQNSGKYFEPSGDLKLFKTIYRKPLFNCLDVALAPLTQSEREGAANFMNRCLQTLPAKRATALELLEDPWLASGSA